MQTKERDQIQIIVNNDQAVTSSRNVAENFKKRHDHVLRDIDNLLLEDRPNFGEMFFESTEPDSYGRPQKVYYMNRDGFSFLVMGFTGAKAREFKLAYIYQFNRMEQQIKEQLDTSQLSPELQMFNALGKALAKQELATKQIEKKMDGITELMSMETKDWRKEVNTIIRRIAIKQGGFDKFSETVNESYERLERKARCNLTLRLENRKKNMIAQGLGKSSVQKLNKLDVIEEDHRLKEIYVTVVKSMALKYGLWEEQR
ncbi:Rha family transcriptional regulator [Alkalibacterium thalassium]|uniref:Phage regulatory protein, rha family n=1 Tax=Alkalibacterium thalassium TaxID=426701 RepID=A0A1G8VSX9_9LACT|nr:Rha family transcriptional regulator [Alkalibacterium thalassium]SDJ69122.1 phage regulatory protein, rha family [Alkalibacterium thalassium]